MLRGAAITAALGLALPSVAAAAAVLDRAAEALRDDVVYVDPDAERALSEAEADRLRSRIREAGGGVYVAILPDRARLEAGGDEDAVVRELGRAVGRDGTYAVVVGDSFRAASSTLRRGEAGRLATQAFREQRDEGVAATLLAFVDAVSGRSPEASPSAEEEDEGRPGWLLPVLVGAGAGGIGFVVLRRRRRERAEFAQVRRAAEEDLLALAEDIRALDLDVEMPGVAPEATEAYGRAVAAYQRADAAFDRARRPHELEGVTAAIEEGRYAMAAAKARLDGREPPPRRPPCFFDPRHGPSSRDVEWAPPGGVLRLVPACEADALAVESGDEPAHREVEVGGRRVPYWDAPPVFAPWAGGYFGGLLPGLLIGSMLGGGFPFGGAEDAMAGVDEPGDFGGGDFGGGDFGGGDFGGGDFGGGDFGGGDVGGGDVGGGDF
jgi:hypothetical protein